MTFPIVKFLAVIFSSYPECMYVIWQTPCLIISLPPRLIEFPGKAQYENELKMCRQRGNHWNGNLFVYSSPLLAHSWHFGKYSPRQGGIFLAFWRIICMSKEFALAMGIHYGQQASSPYANLLPPIWIAIKYCMERELCELVAKRRWRIK